MTYLMRICRSLWPDVWRVLVALWVLIIIGRCVEDLQNPWAGLKSQWDSTHVVAYASSRFEDVSYWGDYSKEGKAVREQVIIHRPFRPLVTIDVENGVVVVTKKELVFDNRHFSFGKKKWFPDNPGYSDMYAQFVAAKEAAWYSVSK